MSDPLDTTGSDLDDPVPITERVRRGEIELPDLGHAPIDQVIEQWRSALPHADREEQA